MNIERRMLQLKGKIKDTAEAVVSYKTGKRRRKPWITDEMLETRGKMEKQLHARRKEKL